MDVGQCFGVMRLQGPQNNVHKSFAEEAEGCTRAVVFLLIVITGKLQSTAPEKPLFRCTENTLINSDRLAGQTSMHTHIYIHCVEWIVEKSENKDKMKPLHAQRAEKKGKCHKKYS